MKRVVFVIRNARLWLFSALLIFCLPSVAGTEESESLVVQAVAAARTHSKANQAGIIREFAELLALRNVASNHGDMRRNAEFILGMLRRRGVESRLLEAPGSPPGCFWRIEPGCRVHRTDLRPLRRPAGTTRAMGVRSMATGAAGGKARRSCGNSRSRFLAG